jgi:hypothetical protein
MILLHDSKEFVQNKKRLLYQIMTQELSSIIMSLKHHCVTTLTQ